MSERFPRFGPRRLRDFIPAQRMWTVGVPNLRAAAQASEVPVFVSESMVFAYGYDTFGPGFLTEEEPYPGPPPLGQAGVPMLSALRSPERLVLESGSSTGTRGIVLRYGIFHGHDVPHTQYTTRLTRMWAMPAAAAVRGVGGEIYKVVE